MFAIENRTRVAGTGSRVGIVGSPRILVSDGGVAPWMASAVADAGGAVVTDPSDADAIVWTNPYDAEGLQRLLADAPDVRWVQLPWAGVEHFAHAGLFDDGRTWTCGKGVYAEPVAEHALMLMLAGFRDLPERVRATKWTRQSGRTSTTAGSRSSAAAASPSRCSRCWRRCGSRPPSSAATRGRWPAPPASSAPTTWTPPSPVPTPSCSPWRSPPRPNGIVDRRALDADGRARVAGQRGARPPRRHRRPRRRAQGRRRSGAPASTSPTPSRCPRATRCGTCRTCIITPHTANTLEMAKPILTARIAENVRRFVAGEPLVGPVDPTLATDSSAMPDLA